MICLFFIWFVRLFLTHNSIYCIWTPLTAVVKGIIHPNMKIMPLVAHKKFVHLLVFKKNKLMRYFFFFFFGAWQVSAFESPFIMLGVLFLLISVYTVCE